MNKILTCILVESKKFSLKIPLMSILVLTLVPLLVDFSYLFKRPIFAENLGIISTKAQIVGTADWPSYLSLLVRQCLLED